MKKACIIVLCVAFFVTVFAQDKLLIYKTGGSIIEYLISEIDSLTFGNNYNELIVNKTDKTTINYTLSEIDSIGFGESVSDTVSITYSGTSVTVVNPLSKDGITVSTSGADVVVTSTLEENKVNYLLKGTTANGSLKIYSNYKFDMILSGVSITNDDGPALNIQSSKKCEIKIDAGTVNSLIDGTTYATSTENQKGAFFSEGQLVFKGTGSLTVKSNSAHGICSDDYIEIDNGNIIVSGAVKDGIHSKDYFKMLGGTVNITASGDGIDCEEGHVLISAGTVTSVNATADTKGISCDSTMTISGGTINLTVKGTQSRGLKSKQNMTLSGGTITITASGDLGLVASGSGFDPTYCTAIKSDATINVSGSNITITHTGKGSKGISADGNINITSGTVKIITSGSGTTYKNSSNVTDSYSAACITTNANLSITGGNINCSSSGTGGKGISVDGTVTIGSTTASPTLNITTTGARFLVSGSDYCHPKTMVSPLAITINNGTNTFTSSDDGIHSDASITVNGGTNTVTASSTTQGVGEGVEAPVITFSGGTTNITASNDGINATKGTVSGGTEQNDGSYLYVTGGIVIVAGSDAVDSNGNIQVTGGTMIVNGPSTGAEEGFDFNGTFNINGGLIISAGSSSNMTKAMNSTSTQPGMYIKSSSLIAASSLLHIENASGTDVITFKPKNGGYYFHASSSLMIKGASYKIYTGGSYTGGSFVGGTSGYGLYTGGTYSTSGASLKSTTSLLSNANTITF